MWKQVPVGPPSEPDRLQAGAQSANDVAPPVVPDMDRLRGSNIQRIAYVVENGRVRFARADLSRHSNDVKQVGRQIDGGELRNHICLPIGAQRSRVSRFA